MKVVILGIGHWHALWHVGALQRLGHIIAGVWDHDAVRAEQLGRQIGCTAYPDVHDALERSRPDWPSFHRVRSRRPRYCAPCSRRGYRRWPRSRSDCARTT